MHEEDHFDRGADQYPCPQRIDRGGESRAVRQGICGGRDERQGAGRPDQTAGGGSGYRCP